MKHYKETVEMDRWETSDGKVWKDVVAARDYELHLLLDRSDKYCYGEVSFMSSEEVASFLENNRDEIFEIMGWEK